MNRSEIRQRILDGLNETLAAPVHFSATQINDIITEGMEILAEEVEAVRRTVFVGLQEGVTWYHTPAIASDLMMPVRLWTYDNSRPMTAVGLRDLDNHDQNWEDVTGNPEAWVSISWDIIGIYPHPATAGGVMRVDYVAWPRELLDDSDEPEFPESSQDGIVQYGIYTGQLKRYDAMQAVDTLQQFASQWHRAKAESGVSRSPRIFTRSNYYRDQYYSGTKNNA